MKSQYVCEAIMAIKKETGITVFTQVQIAAIYNPIDCFVLVDGLKLSAKTKNTVISLLQKSM